MTAPGQNRVLPNGRSSSRIKPHKPGKIGAQFISHPREMRQSPAWKALKSNDKLALERLEEEHMAQGGAENGKLIVTFDDFEKAGIRKGSIAVSVARVEALGFVECIERGRQAYSEFKRPSRYRLTYAQGNLAPTHDWTLVCDAADAQSRIDWAVAELRRRSAPLAARLRTKRHGTATSDAGNLDGDPKAKAA